MRSSISLSSGRRIFLFIALLAVSLPRQPAAATITAMASYSPSPAPSPGSPAYRKGVAFGQPGWRASRASRGRASLVESPSSRGGAPSSFQGQPSPLIRGSTPLGTHGALASGSSSSLSRHTVGNGDAVEADTQLVDSTAQWNEPSDIATPHERSRTKRKRLIRQRPLLERIQQWPADAYYRFTSSVLDIEEQLFADQAGNVLGILLHAFALLALFLSPESSLGSWIMNKPAYRKAQNPAIAYEYLVSHTGDEYAMADALKRHARKTAVHQASDRFFRFASAPSSCPSLSPAASMHTSSSPNVEHTSFTVSQKHTNLQALACIPNTAFVSYSCGIQAHTRRICLRRSLQPMQ